MLLSIAQQIRDDVRISNSIPIPREILSVSGKEFKTK